MFTGKLVSEGKVRGYFCISDETLTELLAKEQSTEVVHNGVVIGHTATINQNGSIISVFIDSNKNIKFS